MIKQFNDFATTKAYSAEGGFEQLPRGGYVCKILSAKIEEPNGKQMVKIAFDVLEGDYKGFFQKSYEEDTREDKKWPISGTYALWVPLDDGSKEDGWTKRTLKTFTDALEESNNGYHFDWDEQKFKGKSVGLIFNYKSYKTKENKFGMSPNVANACSVSAIRSGAFKVPDDKYIKGASKEDVEAYINGKKDAVTSAVDNGFVNIPEGVADELPF